MFTILKAPASSLNIEPISTGSNGDQSANYKTKFTLNGRKRKLVKYPDESYDSIEGIRSEELLQLYNFLLEVKQATTNYRELKDEQLDILEELANSYKVMVDVNNKRDAFKQYLDLKYRN